MNMNSSLLLRERRVLKLQKAVRFCLDNDEVRYSVC